jgi:NAD(P)-dependent dehydrogenase (short-subunit alcohol dehydrogenase family)
MNAKEDSMNRDVLVVIGAGGIGQAIARRQGAGKSVLLADFNENTLQAATKAPEGAGHSVSAQRVDVSSRESVSSLAQAAAALGNGPSSSTPPDCRRFRRRRRRSSRLICSM